MTEVVLEKKNTEKKEQLKESPPNWENEKSQ